ncbi:MAG: FtsW/RodA/SpoVE family cell cycle protein [Oscillospiraceae bacterium]
MDIISSFFENFDKGGDFINACLNLSRYILPALALWLLVRCVCSMLAEKYEPEIWAYLKPPKGEFVPIRHWECVIGRANGCDIVLHYPTISRNHAVLIRNGRGTWRLYDLGSKGGAAVNGQAVPEKGAVVSTGDILTLSDISLRFEGLNREQLEMLSSQRHRPGGTISPAFSLFILTMFQFFLAIQYLFSVDEQYIMPILLAFCALTATQWCYYFFIRAIRRTGIEVETIAFFLCTLGMAICASSTPEEMMKQMILTLSGIVIFFIFGWWLRDLTRVKLMRVPMLLCALAALAVTLALGQEEYGAKNWLSIGGLSLQPSELVKIAYIYAGAATLDRLYRNRNLIFYIGFSAACVGALALMGDFGTALVFFITFLVISFMRSGNIATVVLAVTSAALAGFLMLNIKPHIAQRFASWGHIWEDPYGTGFQQTRALSAAASGGFFGAGAGKGWLHSVFAADTDMVFAMLSEELGLIIAMLAVLAIVILALFTVKNAADGRSSFYVIAACAAVSMMLAQLALNVFGSLDILPFTGVTFPFVSKGGSSLISCWALLAFIKASDTRQNASFVVKATSLFSAEDFEEDDDEDVEDEE